MKRPDAPPIDFQKIRRNKVEVWLESVAAQLMWHAEVPSGTLECYSVNQRIILFLWYKSGHGFEVFRPASDSNRTFDTLAALAEYCGVAAPPEGSEV